MFKKCCGSAVSLGRKRTRKKNFYVGPFIGNNWVNKCLAVKCIFVIGFKIWLTNNKLTLNEDI